MADLGHQVETAIGSLKAVHAQQADQWTNLFLALGRARQAVAMRDAAEARDWLSFAEGLEYTLTGSADTIGAVVETIEREVGNG